MVVRVEVVAELFITMQGLRQGDLDEAEGKPLQPVLPPLGALVVEVEPDEHRRVQQRIVVAGEIPPAPERRYASRNAAGNLSPNLTSAESSSACVHPSEPPRAVPSQWAAKSRVAARRC
ncbi:hypothetical protein ACIPWE_39985 [Streptomyces sp. NPDC090073]|uniref:hypothetical protein n=1 Tax=Streptomyces sp. NPDC090073 TaxID=3365936 RepID=UPI00382BDF5B